MKPEVKCPALLVPACAMMLTTWVFEYFYDLLRVELSNFNGARSKLRQSSRWSLHPDCPFWCENTCPKCMSVRTHAKTKVRTRARKDVRSPAKAFPSLYARLLGDVSVDRPDLMPEQMSWTLCQRTCQAALATIVYHIQCMCPALFQIAFQGEDYSKYSSAI